MINSAIKQDLKYIFLACRPYQWIKNSIVFFPLFFGKRLFETGPMTWTICMFLIFCMIASAGYLVNDILDYEVDKHHPNKSKRPFAADKISKKNSILLAIVLMISGLLFTWLSCRDAILMISVYIIVNGLYNLWLKKIVIIDLVCITMFYLLRILSGAVSAGVVPSMWIICCTTCLSIYLGLSKRYFDCQFTGAGATKYICRYYGSSNSKKIICFLATTLVLLYFFYVINQLDDQTFGHLMAVTGSLAFVGSGIIRHVYLVFIGQYGGDAIIMLLKDRLLLLSVIGWFVLTGLKLYPT